MSLSIDVFLYKSDGVELLKTVYFTAIYRCDQDIPDTLNVCNHVIKQINK